MSGKDANKNPKLTREHDFVFKAATHDEAAKWWDVISRAAGIKTGELPAPTPATSRESTLVVGPPPPAYDEKDAKALRLDTSRQEGGELTGGSVVQSPIAATPIVASAK